MINYFYPFKAEVASEKLNVSDVSESLDSETPMVIFEFLLDYFVNKHILKIS